MLTELNVLATRQYGAFVCSIAGADRARRHTAALDLLDRAYDEHDFALVFLRVAPWFESLREDAGFAQIATQEMPLPAPARSEKNVGYRSG